MKIWKTLLMEFYGTTLITYCFNVSQDDPVAVGFATLVATVTSGLLTGAHFNPAVTLGAILSYLHGRELSGSKVALFMAYMPV